MIIKRRICWPDPDATCLDGGCIACRDQRLRSMSVIEAWAKQAGQVHHRYGDETIDAWDALCDGIAHNFFERVEYVTDDGKHHNLWES